MRFGPVPVGTAEGAILAHALKLGDGRIAKGTRLAAGDVARIAAAGLSEVVAAVLDEGDLAEDEAAARFGAAAEGPNVVAGPAGTGRVNLFSEAAGLFLPDRAVIDRLNAIDPGITLATLAEFEPVEAGRMVATVKIIPLAVPGAAVAQAVALLNVAPAFRVAPYRPRRVALVQTELAGTKASVLDKTRAVLARRLDASGSTIVCEWRCAHRTEALVAAIGAMPDADLLVVFGASAVIDARDVIPAAVEAAGGRVTHLGMPVDPGNLLLLGAIGEMAVIGAPGCARSPKENGFDWVLNRLLAGIPITGDDIRRMGVGGLLMEIASRPQPRAKIARIGGTDSQPAKRTAAPAADAPSSSPRPASGAVVDVAILAAGRSSRMGGPHKLLATFDGVPLVRRSAATALGSGARRVRVVVGHRSGDIAAALDGLDVDLVVNPSFADGLSTSLAAGFRACMEDDAPDGVLVMLADQPFLTPDAIDRMIAVFRVDEKGAIVVATSAGRRGNPVLISRIFAPDIGGLVGDVGARSIVFAHADRVLEVEIGAAAAIDVDTPEAMAAAGGILADREALAR